MTVEDEKAAAQARAADLVGPALADLPGVYLFLASAASAYITGTTITVDGGCPLL